LEVTEALIEMEKKLTEMLAEIKELKMKVYSLEQQNQQLRAKLYTKPSQGQGYENLARLYEEGFHICPMHFATARNQGEDCLFCLGFLRRE